MSPKPVGFLLSPLKYDNEFLWRQIPRSISNLILNKEFNQKRAPNQLIKKRLENERKLTRQLKSQKEFIIPNKPKAVIRKGNHLAK